MSGGQLAAQAEAPAQEAPTPAGASAFSSFAADACNHELRCKDFKHQPKHAEADDKPE